MAKPTKPESKTPEPEPTQSESSLRLNFRNVPMESVLDYLRRQAGYIIHVNSNVETSESIDFWQDQPVDPEDAFGHLQNVLQEKGCTAFQDGRLVTIIKSQDAKKNYIPIPLPKISSPPTAEEKR